MDIKSEDPETHSRKRPRSTEEANNMNVLASSYLLRDGWVLRGKDLGL
jgi:hypothetical protein